MPVKKPYYLTSRQLIDGSYANSGNGSYVLHNSYSENPERYVRAFEILLQDTAKLFEYIEPADKNLKTFSYRIHEILIRTCVEFEANCKAILKKNGYISPRKDKMNTEDYKLIEHSHMLSGYSVKLPQWMGTKGIFQPFKEWKKKSAKSGLSWYTAYNNTKHGRAELFDQAEFQHMMHALAGLQVILFAQYRDEDFHSPNFMTWSSEPHGHAGYKHGIGNIFLIKPPTKWPKKKLYDFNWQTLEAQSDPFNKFDYNGLSTP